MMSDKNVNKSRRGFTKRCLIAPFALGAVSALPSSALGGNVKSFDVSKYESMLVPKGHGEVLSIRKGHQGRSTCETG